MEFFCINDSGVMEGLVTDGDIRRALLINQDLSVVVSSIMNKKFIYGKVSNTKQENLALLNAIHKHIPIVDEMGVPKI